MITFLYRIIVAIALLVIVAISLASDNVATILKCLVIAVIILIALVDRLTYKK